MTRQNKASSFSFLFLTMVVLVCASILWQMDRGSSLDYAQVRQLFQQEKVEAFSINQKHLLTMQLREPVNGSETVRYQLYSFELFYDDLDELVQSQVKRGVIQDYDYPPPEGTNWLELLLPLLMTAGMVGFMWYVLVARGQGGGGDRMAKFGLARTRTLNEGDRQVTFADVAGADEEKEELQEIVEFLKDPQKYIALGARIPKGVLLGKRPRPPLCLLTRSTPWAASGVPDWAAAMTSGSRP